MTARAMAMTRSQRSQYRGRGGMPAAARRSREPEGRPGPPAAEPAVVPRPRPAAAGRRRAPERDGCPSWVVTVRALRAVPRAACLEPEEERGRPVPAAGRPEAVRRASPAGRRPSLERPLAAIAAPCPNAPRPQGARAYSYDSYGRHARDAGFRERESPRWNDARDRSPRRTRNEHRPSDASSCAAECRLPFDPLPCARLYRRPRPALRWRARADRLAEASAPGRGPRPTASSGATGTVTGWEAPRRAGATGPRGRG